MAKNPPTARTGAMTLSVETNFDPSRVPVHGSEWHPVCRFDTIYCVRPGL